MYKGTKELGVLILRVNFSLFSNFDQSAKLAVFIHDWVMNSQSDFYWVLYKHQKKFPLHKKMVRRPIDKTKWFETKCVSHENAPNLPRVNLSHLDQEYEQNDKHTSQPFWMTFSSSSVSELSANSSIQLSKEQIIQHLNRLRANIQFISNLTSIENKLKIKTHLIFKRWFEFVVYHFLVEYFC